MQTWKCQDCGLYNSKSVNKCIACFSYNRKRVWQCTHCNLLNSTPKSKCSACFNTKKLSIYLGNVWTKTYLNIIPPIAFMSKMIIYNNKLYSIIVSYYQEQIKVYMHNHAENESPKSKLTANDFGCYPDSSSYWQAKSASFCIDHQHDKILIIFTATKRDMSPIRCNILIIFDLISQKIQKTYKLQYAKITDMLISKI